MTDPPTDESAVVRMLDRNEAHLLEQCAAGVLDWPVDPKWSAEFFGDPRHHIAAAILNDIVIGIATGYHYVHPDKRPELYINEISVSEKYRRQGIARRLLHCLFRHGRDMDCHKAWLLTEKKNDAARALYLQSGGKESADEPVYYSFRLLSPEAND